MGVQNKIFLWTWCTHMALDRVSCPKIFMSLDCSIGHPDQHRPPQSMALRHRHCPRWQARPWSSSWPLVITKSLDNNQDLGCHRVTGSGMAPCTAHVQMIRWSQLMHWPPKSAWHQQQHTPQTTTWPQVPGQSLGIHVGSSANLGQRHQQWL